LAPRKESDELWLLAPLAVLIVLIAVFAPVETMVAGPAERPSRPVTDNHRIGLRGGAMAEDRVRVRDLAAATPASRDRYVDFLRAFAIVMVVVGHWLAVMITFRDGRLAGSTCSPFCRGHIGSPGCSR
jgi:hypothetical protein